MYMFFWFFKQLYYILKRIFKHAFLLLLAFFIFFLIFFYPKVFAFDITNNNITYHVTTNIPTQILTHFFNNYYNSSTDDFIAYRNVFDNNNNTYAISKFPKNTNIKLYLNKVDNSTSSQRYYLDLKLTQNVQFTNYVYTYQGAYSRTSTNTSNSITDYSENTFNTNNDVTVYFASSKALYNSSLTNVLIEPYSNSPTITTPTADIENWSFDTLDINLGSYNDYPTFWLDFTYDNTLHSFNLVNFLTSTDSTYTASVPNNILTSPIVVRDGSTISFNLTVRRSNNQVLYYELGDYTLDLTQTEQDTINENSNKELINSISSYTQQTINAINEQTNAINEQTESINEQTNAINEQTESINEQTDYLKDDTINNNFIYLPSDNSNDITKDGVNSIFTTIYNAFCTGTPQDIVFPIPFTNKNITLSPTYVRTMLENNGCSWVITFITAFWWFFISRFIIKDIMNKVNKIKSGNLEAIETTNIKGDML